LDKDQHIEDFIRKQLAQAEEANDGWTIPSDEIWQKAKEEINVSKKKRRFFWLFFLGISSLVFLIAYVRFFQQESSHSIFNEIKEIGEERALTTNGGIHPCLDQTPEATENNVSTSGVEHPDNLAKKAIKQAEVISGQPYQTAAQSMPKEGFPENHIQDKPVEPVARKNGVISTVVSKELIKEKAFTSGLLVGTITQNLVELSSAKKEEINYSKIALFETLEVLPFTQIRSITAKNQAPNLSLLSSEPKEHRGWKRELGGSYSRFFQNPFTDDEEQHRQNNKYLELLSESYRSTNIVLTSALGKRKSLTTGLYFLQQKIDVAYGLDSLIYDNQNPLIEKELSDLTAKVAAGTTGNDLELSFLPDAEVVNGDTLSLFGNLPIRLRAYQIPVLVNIHLGQRKRLEYLLTAGVSIDIVKLRVDELPIEVFKNNQLVSNDINFQPSEVMLLGASLYMGGGVKYHFSPQFNISASIKFEPAASEFSRYELGAHQRF